MICAVREAITARRSVATFLLSGLLMWAGANDALGQSYIWTTFAGNPAITNGNDGTNLTASFNQPTGVICDAVGNLYIADQVANTVRKITPDGVVTTLAGKAGTEGITDGIGSLARFNHLSNLAQDSAGNIFVADTLSHTIRKVTLDGVVTTFAGSANNPGFHNATGTNALFNQPNGLTFDSSDTMYVADGNNNAIRKVTTNAVVSTVSTAVNFPENVAMGPSNMVYVADALNNTIDKMTPAGVVTVLAGQTGVVGSRDGTGTNALFSFPESLAVDNAGYVYVADYGNDTIRKITPAGVVTTIGGQVGIMNTNNGTGTNALFNQQEGITVDSLGNVYVADTQNNTIRIGYVGPPGVFVQPQSLSLTSGVLATFSVVARGAPTLAYQWLFNGSNLTNNANISGARSNVLSIGSVSAANAGTYALVVSNSFGSVMTSNALLTVQTGAGALVQNGGFESGSFAGWVTNGDFDFCSIVSTNPYVHSGSYGAQLGPPGGFGYISQTLPTAVGQPYVISFWLNCDGQTPNEFLVSWNGVNLFDQQNIGNVGWTNLQLAATATSTNSVLMFGFENAPSYFGLDDIAVYTNVVFWTNPAAITYGTALSSAQLNAAASVPGNFTYNPPSGTVLGAGVNALTVNFVPNDSTHYSNETLSVNLNVLPATLDVTANNASRVYGSNNPAFTATYRSFVNGQSLTNSDVAGAPLLTTLAGASSPAGTYVISNSLGTLTSTNYTFAFSNGTLTVTPARLTVAANNTSRPYGASNPVFTANYAGFVNGDTLANSDLAGAPLLTTLAGTNSPVGAYVISNNVGSLTSTNYTFAFSNGTLTVAAINLTITASNGTKTYGDIKTFTGTEFSASGLYGTDTVTSVTLGSPGAQASASVGQYPISASAAMGAGLGNYIIGYSNGTLLVTPANLTVAADTASRPYGSTNPVFTAAYSGFISGESLTNSDVAGAPLLTTLASTNSPVGAYVISNSLGSLTSTNYTFAFSNGTLTVTPINLTITASNATKVYGQTRTFTGTEFSSIGLYGADSVTNVTLSSLGAPAAAAVGQYSILATDATGVGLGNYTISYSNGVLTVTSPTPVTINAPLFVGNGTVELTFTGGDAGLNYRIQASSSVTNAAWNDLSTNLAGTNGLPLFTDVTATNSGARFYRTVTP